MGSVDERSEAELLVALGAGDRDALRTLYDRHAAWLTLRLSRRCADVDTVDQAIQDTFLAIWRKPASYGGRGDVGAWMWGIAIRRLLDQLRRRPSLVLGREDSTVVSAEELVLLGVEHGHLAGALHALSPELRSVVQATVLDGLTTREAGRLLGIPTGTVKTRMARARLQMREALA